MEMERRKQEVIIQWGDIYDLFITLRGILCSLPIFIIIVSTLVFVIESIFPFILFQIILLLSFFMGLAITDIIYSKLFFPFFANRQIAVRKVNGYIEVRNHPNFLFPKRINIDAISDVLLNESSILILRKNKAPLVFNFRHYTDASKFYEQIKSVLS